MLLIVRKFFRKLIIQQHLQKLKKVADVGDNTVVSRQFSWRLPREKSVLSVGPFSQLDGRVVVRGSGKIFIGSHCSFRAGTYIGSVNRITIGNNVFCAENIFITDNNNHPVSPRDRFQMTMFPPGSKEWSWERPDVISAPVVIQDNVWIGRCAMILKGVTIGRGSIVGAGAVVTNDVAPFSVVVGNPARIVKTIQNDWDGVL